MSVPGAFSSAAKWAAAFRPGGRDLVLAGVVLFLAVERGLPAVATFAQGDIAPANAPGAPLTAFTYQGRLEDNGVPAGGAVDLEFKLWDAEESGSLVASAGPYTNVPVVNGLFAAQVDFAQASSDGRPRWIEVLVKPSGGGGLVSMGRVPFGVAPHDHLFQAWLGSGAGAALTIENSGGGDALSLEATTASAIEATSSGADPTIWAINTDNGGRAVVGDAPNGNGVVGMSSTSGFAATAGIHSGPCSPSGGNVGNVSLACLGLYGAAETGTNGIGAYGTGSYAGLFGKGTGAGVRGDSDSGIGVVGYTSSSSNSHAGVYGFNNLGAGLLGAGLTGLRATGTDYGVLASASAGDGVVGTSATGFGVRGSTDDGGDAGVAGQNLAAGVTCSGLTFGIPAIACAGVSGSSLKADGIGTVGFNSSGTGVAGWGLHGVFGQSQSRGYAGVIGRASTSNCATTTASTICYGVIGDATTSPSNAGVGVMGIGSDAGIWGRATGGGLAALFDGNVQVNGNVSATGTITPSDFRLKKTVDELDSTLARVMALRPVSFEWQDESVSDRAHLGFIAQEVREVFPSLVHKANTSEGTLSIAPLELIPVLTKAIQEQQAEIDALRAGNTQVVPAAAEDGQPSIAVLASVVLFAAVVGGISVLTGTKLIRTH